MSSCTSDVTPTPSPSRPRGTSRGRRRTPSELKWLLNERAALTGEQAFLHRHISQLEAKLHKLDSVRAPVARDLQASQERLTATQQLLSALDATVEMAHPEANPQAAGVVNAWAGRYGRRGALRTFILEQVKTAGPDGISTGELIDRVICQFHLGANLPEERLSVKYSVKNGLRALQSKGLITCTARMQDNGHEMNFWRVCSAPTLSDLRALAALQATGRESSRDRTGSVSDCARGEVGGQ